MIMAYYGIDRNPRSPYSPEPRAIYRCRHCKEGIVAGEEYAEIHGDEYHLDCLEDMGMAHVLKLMMVDVREAEEE